MKQHLILLSLIITLFSSCGVITKARYGNGYKLNIEWFGNKEKKEHLAEQKQKKQKAVLQSIQEEQTVSASENDSNSLNLAELKKEIPLNATTVQKEEHQTKKQNPKTEQSLGQTQHQKISKIKSKPQYDDPLRPYNSNAMWSGILFYFGFILNFIIPLFGFIFMVIGFVFAIIALRQIKMSGFIFRGYGMALSVIIFFIIYMLLLILLIALIFSFFII